MIRACKVCKSVEKFDSRLSDLIDDMFETMDAAEGAGLAAPQVGILRRVVVVDAGEGRVDGQPAYRPFRRMSGGTKAACPSPGRAVTSSGADHVVVEAQDRKGEKHTYDTNGFYARAVQHELDHLDGVVYLTKKTRAAGRL
ncbi:MAG: peptide deformylase [Eubacteriales bacterium]